MTEKNLEAEKFINNVSEYYQENIKPYLQEGNFSKARNKMENLFLEISINKDIIHEYKSSLNFYIWFETALKKLRENELPSEGVIKNLETYLAQLNLAVKSNNKF